ncbi:MAG TPA: hypothetical protein DDY68_05550, partial [Porphyromonadaceae bacterium]|nr:hypothetical protein [Porphyromonadaceae bacterium]
YGNYYTWGGTHAQSKRKYKDDHWDGDKTLPSSRDIATISWGKEWRIPTEEEFETLLEECGEGEWVEDYMGSGINGRLFRGDGMFAEQELFFPASGYCDHSSFYNLGSDGYYWSSVPYEDNVAWYLSFYNDDVDIYNDKRLSGLSVRAVLNE